MNPVNDNFAREVIPLLDLTLLNDTDTVADIIQLCQQAQTPLGNVAAVCLYPRFIKLAKQQLHNTDIKIASVANFPDGDTPLPQVLREITLAIADGANEIDLVIPYRAYIAGNRAATTAMITQCKALCGTQVLLKVILETGALQQPELITQASQDAIHAGADFIKTSTGKITINATLEAAAIMLTAIKETAATHRIGFKAAGGIREPAQALAYINLTNQIMGDGWISPATFRFGASSLLSALLTTAHSSTTDSY